MGSASWVPGHHPYLWLPQHVLWQGLVFYLNSSEFPESLNLQHTPVVTRSAARSVAMLAARTCGTHAVIVIVHSYKNFTVHTLIFTVL